ncbi:hypothetical protein TKK_0012794 [Trichogramma kaykai]|uniref:Uncharacterized protein n=1 Tax=Trichogramma kaykai TaxID=54128 RepID=A0ABD2WLY8_9HYME
MPSKKADKCDNGDRNLHKINKNKDSCAKSCGVQAPGPKYNLRAVVGYKDHCHSKWREPAYTIGQIVPARRSCVGPGPAKYMIKPPGIPGYTFPKAVHNPAKSCSPGPKYDLPGFWAPAFSIVPKPKSRCPTPTSGPYDPPIYPPGPSFAFAGKPKDKPCQFSPPIRDPGPLCLVYQCPPKFSIGTRPKSRPRCDGPGPAKYFPQRLKCCKRPGYTFGVKFHECVRLPKVECDDQC